jgi:purine catabolism regulator
VGDSRHLADLVEEQLGPLLRTPRAETLVRTLEAYLDSGGSKAATARVLHLRRQSVHQRLARIAALLGRDLDDARQQTALRLALAARRLP